MPSLEQQLDQEYHQHFTQAYRYRYWLVVVNNHFEDVYSIFLYTQKQTAKLSRSYELLSFKRDPKTYARIMAHLKQISHLSIEYRDTHHLIVTGPMPTTDPVHGHGQATTYHPKTD